VKSSFSISRQMASWLVCNRVDPVVVWPDQNPLSNISNLTKLGTGVPSWIPDGSAPPRWMDTRHKLARYFSALMLGKKK
jgi:hypothetical protein